MSSPAFLRKLIAVLLQRKVFNVLMSEGMIGPVEQGLQVNPFLFIFFKIKHPDHLFNFVGHAIKPKQTIKPKKNTQL